MSSNQPASETRSLKVHTNIIFHLVESQAGSLSKAIAEAVMNSYDAGATSIDVTLTEGEFTVRDDGKGFQSREEILKCFETLGFEHDDRDRELGRFGLGRAQAWAFASTLWRSHGYELDVDIKHRGTQYDLRENCADPYPGVLILGKLYEKITQRDIGTVERELEDLVLYCKTKVLFNGKQITRDRNDEKWPHSIEGVKIRLNKDAANLAIYNRGIFVCEMAAFKLGAGGVVIAEGEPFKLNMARNAIIESSCPVWKRVKPVIESIAGVEREKRRTLTNDDRRHLRSRLYREGIAATDFENLIDAKIFQCVDKRWHSFLQVIRYEVITFAPLDSAYAKRVHDAPGCFVMAKNMLDDVRAPSLREYLDRMIAVKQGVAESHSTVWRRDQLRRTKLVEDFREACPEVSDSCQHVETKDLTPTQKCVLNALQNCSGIVAKSVGYALGKTNGLQYRHIHAGASDTAQAWTDGASKIWIEQRVLTNGVTGLPGALQLITLLVEKYLHDFSDVADSGHPPEFYERFQEVMHEQAHYIALAVESFLRSLSTQVRNETARVANSKTIDALSDIQHAVNQLDAYLKAVHAAAQLRDLSAPSVDDESGGLTTSGTDVAVLH